MQLGDLIELLVSNGFRGENSRVAFRQLEASKGDPSFVVAVANIFASVECPVPPSASVQQASWPAVRQVAGFYLKTLIHAALPAEALAAIAQAALGIVNEAGVGRLANAAGVVIARLTAAMGVAWWDANGLSLSNLLLEDMLVSQAPERVITGLMCLLYLVEDAANQIGSAVATILTRVCAASTSHSDQRVRDAALEVMQGMYAYGAELDWAVDNLSVTQRGMADAAYDAGAALATLLSSGQLSPDAVRRCFDTAFFLVDYTTYILQANPEAPQVFTAWAGAVVNYAGSSELDVAWSAIEFMNRALRYYDSCGYDEASTMLAQPIVDQHPTLIPILLRAVVLSDAEVEEVTSTDHYTHRDAHVRKSGAKKKSRSSAGSGTVEGEEMVSEATLRAAACKTLHAAAIADCEVVYNTVMPVVTEAFNSTEWRAREAAIAAVGEIHEGCQRELNPFLPQLIPTLGAGIGSGDPSESHVCLITISIWALGKFSEWAMGHNAQLFDQMLGAVLPCFTSLSKHVQWAAVTMVRDALTKAIIVDPSGGPFIQHIPKLLEQIVTCVPVYHTNNLALLCTVTVQALPLAPEHVDNIVGPFEAECQKRLGLLQQSMDQRYVQNDSRVNVDMDAFELGALVGMAVKAFPSEAHDAHARTAIGTWCSVLQYAMQLDVASDDAALILWPLQLIGVYVDAMRSQTLAAVFTESQGLPYTLASTCGAIDDDDIKAAACAVIHDLLNMLGTAGVPSCDDVVRFLVGFGTAQQHAAVLGDAGLLAAKLFEVFPEGTDDLRRYARLLGLQVRGDHIGNQSMILLAQCVGTMMTTHPAVFDVKAAAETALALKQGDNEFYKATATQGVVTCITHHASSGGADPAQLGYAVASLVKLALSWQDDVAQYAGLAETVSTCLANAMHDASMNAVLQHELTEMPPNVRNLFHQFYRV